LTYQKKIFKKKRTGKKSPILTFGKNLEYLGLHRFNVQKSILQEIKKW
jgi:hypothetical protein